MSNYNSLKATIDANIKQNGRQEITGQILNSVLNQMVTTLGAGYQFAGVATIDTNPGTPDAKVFYIANGKGTYTNFGGINVTEDEVVVLYWDTAWHKVSTGIASQAKLTELDKFKNNIQGFIGPDNIEFSKVGEVIYTNGSHEYGYGDNYRTTDFINITYIDKIYGFVVGNGDIANIVFYETENDNSFRQEYVIAQNGEFNIDLNLEDYKSNGINFVKIATSDFTSYSQKINARIGVVHNLDDIEKAVKENSHEIKELKLSDYCENWFISSYDYVKGFAHPNGTFDSIGSPTYGFIMYKVRKDKTYNLSGVYDVQDSVYANILFYNGYPTNDSVGEVIDSNKGSNTPFNINYTPKENGYIFIWATDSNVRYKVTELIRYNLKEVLAISQNDISNLQTKVGQLSVQFDTIGEVILPNGVRDYGYTDNYRRTGMIDVSGFNGISASLKGNGAIVLLAFYDSNYNYIPNLEIKTASLNTYIDLRSQEYSNVKYIASCVLWDDTCSLILTSNGYAKKIVTYNTYLGIGDSLTNSTNWIDIVKEYVGIRYTNRSGAHGMTMANIMEGSIYNSIQNLTKSNGVDLISIWAGTNDFAYGVTIGDFNEQLNSSTRDVTTFYGAYIASVEKLMQIYPEARIFLIGTTPRSWDNGDSNYHKTPINGHYLYEFVDATKKVADYFGLPFLDLLRTSGININNITHYMFEQHEDDNLSNPAYWLHFNDYGRDNIAKRIASFIISIG